MMANGAWNVLFVRISTFKIIKNKKSSRGFEKKNKIEIDTSYIRTLVRVCYHEDRGLTGARGRCADEESAVPSTEREGHNCSRKGVHEIKNWEDFG